MHNAKKNKNIITAGCSFTSDGIGGTPPSKKYNGNSSFGLYEGIEPAVPNSWASWIAKKLQPPSFVNLASASHGNILIAHSIIDLLSKFNYSFNDTLILLNLTSFYRYDIPCEFDNPDASPFVPWSSEIIPYTFYHMNSKKYLSLSREIDLATVEEISSNHINFLFNFLSNNRYKFYFLMMEDYFQSPPKIKNILSNFGDHLISFDKNNNMMEFCMKNNITVSKTDHHPSKLGHKIIADIVYQHINKDVKMGELKQ